MTFLEEIAQRIDKALDGDCGYGVGEHLAEMLSPLIAEHDAKVRAEAYKAAEDAAADALTTWWLQETLPADDTDSVMDVRRAIRAAKAKREAGLK